MSDLDSLLSAVLERPADDTVRGVYADCLDEHGRAERAEFIRVQLEVERLDEQAAHLARPDPACRCCELIGREKQLLASERSAGWLAAVLPGLSLDVAGGRVRHVHHAGHVEVRFRRGFVASVCCDLDDWLAHAPALLAAHPVERVEVADVPGLVLYPAYPGMPCPPDPKLPPMHFSVWGLHAYFPGTCPAWFAAADRADLVANAVENSGRLVETMRERAGDRWMVPNPAYYTADAIHPSSGAPVHPDPRAFIPGPLP